MHDLTGFQRDLLVGISGLDSPHGLGIKEQLEGYYEQEIHHGRLYPNLDTLVKKGLISKSEKDRRTNSYTITRRGQRELQTYHQWIGAHMDDERETPLQDREAAPSQ